MLITISLLPYWDKEYINVAMQILKELSNNIPIYTFGFTPNYAGVKYLIDNLNLQEFL